MNPQLAPYFADGCGRCSLVGTPACTVRAWQDAMAQLRRLVLACGLTEELKWSMPCYTFEKNNVVLLYAFKTYCALNFFNGALLQDTHGLLVQQTKNVQAVRQMRFTSVQDILAQEHLIKAYLHEAIGVAKAGLKVEFKKTKGLLFPAELRQKLEAMPTLKTAFEALTPGRQRGYILYFFEPKQATTRLARIEKSVQYILCGKGLHDRN